MLSGDRDIIRLFNVQSNKTWQFHGDPDDYMVCMSLSPDGRVLACGLHMPVNSVAPRHLVRLWEMATGKEIHLLKGHDCFVNAIAWSPDGRVLATGDGYGSRVMVPQTVRLWDVARGKELIRFTGLDADVRALAFSPDSKFLAVGLKDSTILIWDVSVVIRQQVN